MVVRFLTLGCKLNFAETSSIAHALSEHGHRRANTGEEAQLCIVNTCSVTDQADRKDRQAIHRLKRENPNAIIIATGCYAQLKAEADTASDNCIDGVDYIVGNGDKQSIIDLVDHLSQATDVRPYAVARPMREVQNFNHAVSYTDTDEQITDRSQRTRSFLKVQDGCNYFCTYCTIPFARGRSRNPAIRELATQAQKAIDGGAHEIVLTGVNIADFGQSTNESFIDLLRALDELKGDYRLRIGSCEPNLLSDQIIDFVAAAQHIAPHFHLPLQSGSNRMLEIMHRRYTRELFAQRVEHIRNVMPQAFIGVDCMVGVRGETDELFSDYLTFVQNLDVSQLHVFTYSERAKTRMLNMDLYVVPHHERKQRSDIMHRLSDDKLKAFYHRNKGTQHTVLWEGHAQNGLMKGFTENYILTTAPFQPDKVNTFEQIRL